MIKYIFRLVAIIFVFVGWIISVLLCVIYDFKQVKSFFTGNNSPFERHKEIQTKYLCNYFPISKTTYYKTYFHYILNIKEKQEDEDEN